MIFDYGTRRVIRQHLIKQILNAAEKNGGRVPNGFITSLVKKNQESFPFISVTNLRTSSHRARMDIKAKENTNHAPVTLAPSPALRPFLSPAPCPVPSPDSIPTPIETIQDVPVSKGIKRDQGGRPKGTTKEKQRSDKLDRINFMNKASIRLRERHDPSIGPFPDGLTREVIDEVAEELGMQDIHINPCAIRNRVHRNNVEIFTLGKASPTIKLDKPFLEILLRLADIRQCITPLEAIGVANSLIDEQGIGDEIRAYKVSMRMNCDDEGYNKDGTILGDRWWRTFLKRNEHLLVSTRGRKFAINRDSWCIYTNFADMYDNVYDAMASANVAEKLEVPKWLDYDGKEVDKKDAVGRKSTHRVTYPDGILFVDETNGNTSMKNDGNGRNKKVVARTGTTPQVVSSESENRFTTFCFSAVSGLPVLFVTIFRGERKISYLKFKT